MNVRTIRPVKGLKGEVTIPGDKSISHRSIMLGSIALGTTEITHFLEGADCLSTIDCFRRMGVEIERKPSCILVHGKGLRGLSAPASTLNVGNSGTTTRLISGILSGQSVGIFSVIFSSAKVFHIRVHIHFVNPLDLFHMLKSPWKMFKNPVSAPTFRVEFHTLHRVFNGFDFCGVKRAVLFVNFKSEI